MDELYEALRVAEAEGRKDDVARLAAYIEEQSAKQEPPQQDVREEVPKAIGAGAGAVLGPLAAGGVQSGINQIKAGRVQPLPSLSVPHPTELAPGASAVDEAIGKGTSNAFTQHTREAQLSQRQKGVAQTLQQLKAQGVPVNPNLLAEMPTQYAMPGSGIHINVDTARQLEQERAAGKALPKNATMAQKFASKISPNLGQDIANFAKGVSEYKLPFGVKAGPLLGRMLGGAATGMQGIDAYNRAQQGDTTGSIISGIGAAGTGVSTLPVPLPAKLIGGGVGLSAEAINAYRDALRKGQIVHGAPENYENVDPMGNAYAHGGLVYLADGGQPPKPEANEGGAFIGYPQINKNRKIGSGTGFLDALVGAPPSRTNILNPNDYSYMEGYEKGEPYGIASMALPFAGAAAKPLAKEVATRAFMGESLTPKMMRNLMPEQPVLSAVKGPGGNWADNRLDATLNQVKTAVPIINTSRNITQDAGNFIRYNYPEVDEGYNQYFRNTGKHSMEYGKDYWSWMQENHPQQFAALSENKTPSHAMNSWVDSKLKKYIKNDLATPNDPVRELADKGISHLSNLEDRYNGLSDRMKNFRASQGFEPLGYSKSNMGHVWENLADDNVYPTNIKTYAEENPATAKLNSWIGDLAAKDPKAMINEFDRSGTTGLGFDHLVDELRNSITPNSGLPQHLQLKPGALDRVTVPQAVQHVAKINEWRAQQMAQQQLKVQEGLPVHKQYDTGYKWLELKHPENDEFTQKALKYEGDTMGHCVGGYCPDVLSGNTKIYSLRDAKGEPHVTIEVKPTKHHMGFEYAQGADSNAQFPKDFYYTDREGLRQSLPPEQHAAIYARAKRLFEEKPGRVMDSLQQAADEVLGAPAPIIQQIKGKQNAAPKAEYQPFVQDFVRSGNWADVKDLKNAGLLDTKNLKGSNYFSPTQIVDESGNIRRYVTQQELDSFNQ